MLVEALAGTGKTTTAVGCLRQSLDGRIGFVAFNQHIAAELQLRLPPTVPACTLHSLGFAAVRRAFPAAVVDEAKLRKRAQQLAPDAYPSVRIAAEQLARLCKYTLTDPWSATAVERLVDHYGVEIDDRDRMKVFTLTGKLIDATAADTSTVDYDDMVWLPAKLGLRPDAFDLLLVDEAQDLNAAQQAIAKAAVPSGRLLPIGDRHQAIYGFSGADSAGLDTLARELSAAVLPLTVTWRCPASHVELARKIVPTLTSAPSAIDGVVRTLDLKEIVKVLRPGDLVIGRKNSPVVGLTYKLILAGVPALMRGRDIGRGLVQLIRRLKPSGLADLIDRLEDYRQKEERRLRGKNSASGQLEALADRCDCLGQLAAQATSLGQLETFIESKFDDAVKPGECVVLSSVHRAKGLEADNVFVLDPGNLPLRTKRQKPWQVVQEKNLCYIAATRAKRVLTFEDRIPAIFGGD